MIQIDQNHIRLDWLNIDYFQVIGFKEIQKIVIK